MTDVRVIPNEDIAPPPPADWTAPARNGNGTKHAVPTIETERALIAVALTWADTVDRCDGLEPEHFAGTGHADIWSAIRSVHASGVQPDFSTVADQLARDHAYVTGDQLAGYLAVDGVHANAAAYAAIIRREHTATRARAKLAEAADAIRQGADPHTVYATLEAEADRWTKTVDHGPTPWLELDAFIDTAEPDHDWVIPGLLETADRCIITATPGTGKSTLLRQIGLMAASGLHPFTADDITPVRVLMLDVENSGRQIRREIRPLRNAAGTRYDPGMLELRVYGEAINLADPATLTDIQRHVDQFQPGIICTGPLYKLIGGDPILEKDARPVADAFDRIRHVCGSAIIIEAHSPYPVGKSRVIRPYGASLWERWPEFGWYFSKAGDIEHWRGQREERAWPAAIQRGKPWPWVTRVVERSEADEWHGPTKCVEAVIDFLERHPDEQFTGNQLYARLRVDNGKGGFREQTVRDAAEIAAGDGRIGVQNGPRRSRLYSAADPEADNGAETETELF